MESQFEAALIHYTNESLLDDEVYSECALTAGPVAKALTVLFVSRRRHVANGTANAYAN